MTEKNEAIRMKITNSWHYIYLPHNCGLMFIRSLGFTQRCDNSVPGAGPGVSQQPLGSALWWMEHTWGSTALPSHCLEELTLGTLPTLSSPRCSRQKELASTCFLPHLHSSRSAPLPEGPTCIWCSSSSFMFPGFSQNL